MHCREKENRIAMTQCQLPWCSTVKSSVIPLFREQYTLHFKGIFERYYAKEKPKFNSFERQSMGSHGGIDDKMGILSHIQHVRFSPQLPTIIDFLWVT